MKLFLFYFTFHFKDKERPLKVNLMSARSLLLVVCKCRISPRTQKYLQNHLSLLLGGFDL